MITVVPEPLTAGAFAPFGDVIWADPARAVEINDGFTTRFADLARPTFRGGAATISILRGRPRPLRLDMLERHPAGCQSFHPLGGEDWLLAVAERPDPAAVRVFRATGAQGALYRAGAWHHPLLVLVPQDFLVVDRADPAGNLEVADLDPPVAIELGEEKGSRA